VVALETFYGPDGPHVIEGDTWPADDPVVVSRPHLFGPISRREPHPPALHFIGIGGHKVTQQREVLCARRPAPDDETNQLARGVGSFRARGYESRGLRPRRLRSSISLAMDRCSWSCCCWSLVFNRCSAMDRWFCSHSNNCA
jgi:hypothetical protein